MARRSLPRLHASCRRVARTYSRSEWVATVSRPVGGVLSSASRRLGDHPSVRPTSGCSLARASGPLIPNIWPCSGWGLPSHPGRPGCWWSLTPPFHPYLCPTPNRGQVIGGLFSVALSFGSLRLAVSQHPALWSPDLPRRCRSEERTAAVTQPAHRRPTIVAGSRSPHHRFWQVGAKPQAGLTVSVPDMRSGWMLQK